ncbi:hypothetical protein CHCC14431_1565 [Bacillus licheniformis]|nr:hypothetical protein CHCC14431_1565 [Bacillus licheniformis]
MQTSIATSIPPGFKIRRISCKAGRIFVKLSTDSVNTQAKLSD